MTNAATYVDAEGLSRRDLLKRGLIGGGLVAAGLATPGLTGVAQAKGGKSIVLEIDTNGFADFQLPANTNTAPGGTAPSMYRATSRWAADSNVGGSLVLLLPSMVS